MRQLCGATFVFFWVTAAVGQIQDYYRLPGNTRPESYDITLTVDLDQRKFNGTVEIAIVAVVASRYLVLNVQDLSVVGSSVVLRSSDGKVSRPITSVEQNDKETIQFNFEEDMRANFTYWLELSFAGSITSDLKGLYISSYYLESEERFIGTTFNAAAYARTIFPCYDEPQLKAKFRVKVYHSPAYHALSNMPGTRSDTSQQIAVTTFEESPLMSTYLFALVLSDFGSQTSGMYRVFAQATLAEATQYAVNFTAEAIPQLAEYFHRPYQLQKLDIVAIDDFLMGAMENWGLITYKSSRIMYTEGYDKWQKLQDVTKIIFHELVHQWFGNEVTCAWWSVVWLNEGFAVFLESYVLDRLRPQWHLMEQFVVNELHPTLDRDIGMETRPMTKPISTPEEIAGIYDFVVYPKAASVIRMLASLVPGEVFQEFIVTYLDDRSYRSATEDDMIRVFQQAVDRRKVNLPPVGALVKSWSSNPSYPVVTVDRRYDNGQTHVSVNPANTFYVPLTYISSTTPMSDVVWSYSNDSQIVIPLTGVSRNDWVLFNTNQTGYYRVQYDERNWMLLTDALHADHRSIPLLNRAQLLDDALYLAKQNMLSVTILLRLADYLRHETDYVPLKAGSKVLRFLKQMLKGSSHYPVYVEYQDTLVLEIYGNALRQPFTDHMGLLFYSEVWNVACELGLHECISRAYERFDRFFEDDPNVRSAIICGAVKASEVETIWVAAVQRLSLISANFARKRQNLEEYDDILYGLGCAVSAERQEKYYGMAVSDNPMLEPADRVKMLQHLMKSNDHGVNVVLEHLHSSMDLLIEKLGSLGDVLNTLKQTITTREQLATTFEIISKYGNHDLITALHELYNHAQRNVQWIEQNGPKIAHWISDPEGGGQVGLYVNTVVLVLPMMLLAYRHIR